MGYEKSKQIRKPKSSGGTGGAKTAAPYAGSEFRFVKLELDAARKSEFKALMDSGEFGTMDVDQYLRVGYKVTFSAQNEGNTVVCSISCNNPDDANYRSILTGRGRDASTALAVATFKDTYLCENGIWATGEPAGGLAPDDIG